MAGSASTPGEARRACGWLPAWRRLRLSSSGWFGTNLRRRWAQARFGARGQNRPWGPGGDGGATVCRRRIPDGRSRMIGRPFWGIRQSGRWACSAGLSVPSRPAGGRWTEAASGRPLSRTSRRRKAATRAVRLWSRKVPRGRRNGAGKGRCGRIPAWCPRKALRRPTRRVGAHLRTTGAHPYWKDVWRRQACRPWRAGVDCSPPQTTDRVRVRNPFAPQPWCRA